MKKIFLLMLIALMLQSCGAYIACLLATGVSNIRGGSYKDPVGTQIGVETKVMDINDQSYLSGGANFTYQGGGYSDSYVSGRVRLGYLNVPVLYTYEFPCKVYGEIGLQPGFLLLAKDKYNGDSYDYKDQVNKFDLGLPIGLGYKLNDRMSIGLRSTWGFVNVEKSNDESTKNLMVVAMFRYSIDWSKLKK